MLAVSSFPKNGAARLTRAIAAASFLIAAVLPLASANLIMTTGRAFAAPLSFADPAFQQVWDRTDGLVANGQAQRTWLWGPAPGATASEPFAQATNGVRQVQYFDKARMELNPAVTDPRSLWHVTTGLLVTEMVSGRIQTGQNQFLTVVPSTQAVAGDTGIPGNPQYADFAKLTGKSTDLTGSEITATISDRGQAGEGPDRGVQASTFITQTAHNIPNVFWQYMSQTGPVMGDSGQVANQQLFDWVYLMGYPITEAYWSNVRIAGKDYVVLIQLFQRRALTYAPDFPQGWRVQMGNVGQHYYDWRYRSVPVQGVQPTPGPAAIPTILPATGAFVGITGDQFVYAGQRVKLKGTNYWLSTSPFQRTWADWDGHQVQAELEKARELGVNTVRIGIPYDAKDTFDVMWKDDGMTAVSPWITKMMTQILQIASNYGMKVIFVLFEWYDGHPAPDSGEYATNLIYLRGVVGPFANDDRVLAWDLHNEPDNYHEWLAGKQDQVIHWLQRVGAAVRAVDPHHPVTVGVGNFSDLWYPAADGTTILSLVDFAAFHCYDAGGLSRQIATIKAHTTKPVLLEEMGWPTSRGEEAPVPNAVYDEPTQTFLYTAMLSDAKATGIAGVMQWTLWDYTVKRTDLVPGHERFFGLVRADGTFKPASTVFENNYLVQLLPSDTKTNLPLDRGNNFGPKP